MEGFPLLDVWQKHNCIRSPTWVFESLGRPMLTISDVSRSPFWLLRLPRLGGASGDCYNVQQVQTHSHQECMGYFVFGLFPFLRRDNEFMALFRRADDHPEPGEDGHRPIHQPRRWPRPEVSKRPQGIYL
jgi:hypothetical protein